MFTPFYRAWARPGWRLPAATGADTLDWIELPAEDAGVPDDPPAAPLPEAGERAASMTWKAFRDKRLSHYATDRERPDLDGSSRMSPYLRWGCVHPRTLLADLEDEGSAQVLRAELAWREFHADVLWHNPNSARANLDPRFDKIELDDDRELFEAWCWQWVAGSGTDAAPYFRVFNPATQGKKVDPDGDYVRRYAPDSADLEPIVDHAHERQVALARYAKIKD